MNADGNVNNVRLKNQSDLIGRNGVLRKELGDCLGELCASEFIFQIDVYRAEGSYSGNEATDSEMREQFNWMHQQNNDDNTACLYKPAYHEFA